MWRRLALLVALIAFGTFDLAASAQTASPIYDFATLGKPISQEPITPLPLAPDVDPQKAVLGKRLFEDPGLSADGTVSCATCHPLDSWGMDGQAVSTGILGRKGVINAPTVYNAAFNFVQFWNGRAKTLEDQVDGPILNPGEMGSTWPQVLAYLQRDGTYASLFSDLYGELSVDAVKNAIASFERTLITPDAPFDRYLNGESEAISDQAKQGYELFKGYGCSACHQGRGVGGNMYEKIGMMQPYFRQGHLFSQIDLGRFLVTRNPEHRGEFKVPSLRNVEKTAPYFHDGSASTLEEAIEKMAYFQLGRTLPEQDISLIAVFLKSLTGVPPNWGE